MSDLVAFVEARLAEDEARTRDLLSAAQYAKMAVREPRFLGREIPGWHSWPDVEAMCEQQVREIVVKRALLDAYGEQRPYDLPAGVHDGRDDSERLRDEACLDAMEGVVRALATVWSAHPDYNPEWKP